ncbi:MAG: NAD(+)/NADH kinase [Oscillospiraceae bacterium]|jgi:NAD+ kinase|nr:NAD(+)/NADH kinase [Oscillospiraceae bacterium]
MRKEHRQTAAPIHTLGFAVNPHKFAEAERALSILSDACAQNGISLLETDITRADFVPSSIDALFVAGGDGTVLHFAWAAALRGVPIISFNAGTMGFLSEAQEDEIESLAAMLAQGSYYHEERMLLQCKAECCDSEEANTLALNDVVASRGSYSRMVHIDVHADGEYVGGFFGDGVVVSTPTGSTAYSLSSGGSIAAPNARCILLTPICPHSPPARPIILPDSAVIDIDVSSHGEGGGILLTLDGRAPVAHTDCVSLTVSASSQRLRFIRVKPFMFFSRLRGKLAQWSEK